MADSPVARTGTEVADFAELLLVYLLLLFPVGTLGWLVWAFGPFRFGLTDFEARLLAVGLVVAALEITDRRPSPSRAAALTVVDAVLSTVLLFALVFLGVDGRPVRLLSVVPSLVVAYALVFTEAGPWLAERSRETLRRATKTPPQE